MKCVIVLFSLFLIATAVTEGEETRDEYEDRFNKEGSPIGPGPLNQEETEKEDNNQQEEGEYNPLEEEEYNPLEEEEYNPLEAEAEQENNPQEPKETEDLQETPIKEEGETQSQEDQIDDMIQLMSSCGCANRIKQKLIRTLRRFIRSLSNTMNCNPPPSSCAAVKRRNPRSRSGYYCLQVGNRRVRMYCNMGTLCGRRGGWTRLGKLDMTKYYERCPSPFKYSKQGNTRICSKNKRGCESMYLPSYGIRYRQVCGRVRGYQWRGTDAFYRSVNDINKVYVDGVSITRGSPRKHIWSFASGLTELSTDRNGCPCNSGATSLSRPPPFVGNDYYCESGCTRMFQPRYKTEDPLWDGKQCRQREGPCCRKSYLPWFLKNIGGTTSDSLELRLCTDPHEGLNDERVGIDQYEFYVK